MVKSRRYRRHRRIKIANVESKIINVLAIIVAVIFIWSVISHFVIRGNPKRINISLSSVAAFQIPYKSYEGLYNLSVERGMDFADVLTVFCLERGFFPKKTGVTPSEAELKAFVKSFSKIKKSYSEEKLKPYYDLLRSIIEDIEYFPIPAGYDEYMFGDSFGAKRTYGGERSHEGTDIMDKENVRARLLVISMTDGVVENVGWNEKGGFRVGILAESGNYYYYAHLDSFSDNLYKGMVIEAGDFLGYMGDTGYSKVEGVKGNFPVHLHVGISPSTEFSKKEFWINPYIFLRFAETKKVFLTYIE